MSKDPALLFYTSDFLMGVTLLTMEERGQYITTLCLLHQHGGYLPLSQLEQTLGKFSEALLSKFTLKDGRISNKRLLEEALRRQKFVDTKLNNLKGKKKKFLNKSPIGTPVGSPIREPLLENENENKDISIISKGEIVKRGLSDPVLLKTIDDFLEMRKAIKKRPTAKAMELMNRKLTAVSTETAIAMLEQSIENSWSGLFEVKTERKNNGAKNTIRSDQGKFSGLGEVQEI